MTYGFTLTTIQEWWNAGLVTIAMQGLVVYAACLWIGCIVWTMRDSFVRSESILFHIIAFLLSLLTIPGIILYLLIRPTQTVAERKLFQLEEEILRDHHSIKKRTTRVKK